MRIYSHFFLVLTNHGAAMGFNDRLEGCVVEVAVCKPIGKLLVPDAVVAFIYRKAFFRKEIQKSNRQAVRFTSQHLAVPLSQ